MRKLNILFLLFGVLLIGLASAGQFGGDESSIYDEINDSSLNLSLWDESHSGLSNSYAETNDYLYARVNRAFDGTQTIQTNNLNRSNIYSLQTRIYLDPLSHASATNTFFVFGNNIKQLSGVASDLSTYEIIRNLSAGEDKWDVFDDGVFLSQITASNNIFGVTTSNSLGGSSGNLESRIYYLYYNLTGGDITLNSPSDDSSVATNLVTFNASANITGEVYLKNISLYTNETGSWEERNTSNIGENLLTNDTSGVQINLPDSSYSLAKDYDNLYEYISFLNLTGGSVGTGGDTDWFPYNINIQVNFTYNDSTIYSYEYLDVGSPEIISVENLFKDKQVDSIRIYATDGIPSNSNVRGIVDDVLIYNISLYANSLFTNTYSSGDTILWNVLACDSEGDCGFANSNFTFLIDSTPPQPIIIYPSNVINILSNGQSVDLNISVSDSNLDSCWYEYNGTNTTIGSCANTTFNYISGVNNITLWANDTAGNTNSTTTSWTALIVLNNEFHNISTAETASESFTTSITSNDSLTKAYVNYNGTYYLLSESGTNWTTTIDIPLNKVQNNTFNYIYTYAGTNYSSENYYQQVNSTIFNLCNATYTTPFLNLTFKDEEDSSVLNASIPSSTWTYYLGSGLVNKTYTFTNTSVNYNYTFCATPTDRILNVDPYVQYKQDPSYPQRIWDSGVQQYNSSMTTQNLYLLNSADGIYVTFTVYDGSGNALEGVIVNVTRDILGIETLISSGVTSSAGTITFLLNPDFTHTLSFFKENYDSLITSLAPTLTAYTITLGGSSQETDKIDYAKGILINIEPSGSFLNNGTSYNFNYTISTSIWTLDSFGFTLRYGNGTIIGSNSSTTDTGGIVSLDADTLNQSYIIMEYYYEVNNTFINKTKRWNIQTPGEFGISNLFTRISTYISANIFGIEGDDEGYFGKAFISVLILLSSTFILSYRYGIVSEPAIMGIMFGILMLLNNLNLIPTPSFMDSSPISLGTLIVVIMAIFVVSSIYKEERL